MHGHSCPSGSVIDGGRGRGHREEEEVEEVYEGVGGCRLQCWQVIYNPQSPLRCICLRDSTWLRKSTSIWDLRPIYSEKRQIACETESKDVTVWFMEKEGECIYAQSGALQDESGRCVRGNLSVKTGCSEVLVRRAPGRGGH